MMKKGLYFLGLMGCFHVLHAAEDVTLQHGMPVIRWMPMVTTLVLMIGFIVLLGWLYQRFFREKSGGYSQGFSIISTFHMGVREKIVLIQAGNRYLLLGITVQNISLLCDFGETCPEGFAEKVASGGFQAVLGRVLRKKDHEH